MLLANKIIAIIGGTTGLGRSAARACVAAGARVAVIGRKAVDVEDILAEFGPVACGLAADAIDPTAASRLIELAVQRFGPLGGLYHVAGGSGRKQGDGPLDSATDEGWQHTIELNLTSVFYSNRSAVQQFLRQKSGGSILNCGSVLASHPAPKHFATHAYAAAKAGIIGLTKSAAAYYAPQNIRFNVVSPALVETPMSGRVASDETIREYAAHRQPLHGGEIGSPADLDAAVVYFLSDTSRFTTGQVLAIDGGWSVSDAAP